MNGIHPQLPPDPRKQYLSTYMTRKEGVHKQQPPISENLPGFWSTLKDDGIRMSPEMLQYFSTGPFIRSKSRDYNEGFQMGLRIMKELRELEQIRRLLILRELQKEPQLDMQPKKQMKPKIG